MSAEEDMSSRKPDPLDEILTLLRAGAFSRAIPMLEVLSRQQPPRAAVFFNLGLALSETQQFPEALIPAGGSGCRNHADLVANAEEKVLYG